MNFSRLLFVVLCVFLISCDRKQKESSCAIAEHILSFDLDKDIKTEKSLLSLVDSIDVVKLETTEACLIGYISKIVCDEKYIYVLDEKIGNGLFKFKRSGKFVERIGNRGSGPTEYFRISDFFLTQDNIVILDGYSGKVMFFSKSGVFLRSFSKKANIEKIGRVGNNKICLISGYDTSFFSNNKIILVDTIGNKVNEFMKVPSYLKNRNIALYKNTDYFGKDLLITTAFSNDILSFKNDSLYVKYRLDFGERTMGKSFLEANSDLDVGELMLALNKDDIVNCIDFFNENEMYICFTFLKKGKVFQAYYNKRNQKKYIFDLKASCNWFANVQNSFLYSKGNSFTSVFYPSVIKNLSEEDLKAMSENRVFSKLASVIQNTDESDNPILQVFYLKK